MKATVCAMLSLAMAASIAFGEDMVDNPAYKQWASHKPGTSVKMETASVTTAGDQEITGKMTATTTLKEVTPEKVVTEVVVEVEAGGQKTAMPAQTVEILAKVPKSPASQPGVTTTKKGEGDEEITVGDKKYKTHWVEYQTTGDQMESTSKTWTADEAPGGMVKSVIQMTKPMKSKSTIVLVEVKEGS